MKTVRKIEQNQSVQCSRLRVAAYCRVSTDYDAQLESLETQKLHYENYISLQDNWELAGIYFDEGISGTKSDSINILQKIQTEISAVHQHQDFGVILTGTSTKDFSFAVSAVKTAVSIAPVFIDILVCRPMPASFTSSKHTSPTSSKMPSHTFIFV